jgi:cytoskeletal protein RodZ
MLQKKGKRVLVATISVVAIVVFAIGTFIVIRAVNTNNDPYIEQTNTSQDKTDQSTSTPDEANAQDESETNAIDETTTQSSLDPATVGAIDVSTMTITVSYVKGIGAFEFAVLRAQNGTRYVEFRSSELIGTKCTNDMGTFISIIASPTEDEKATLTKTTSVDGTEYGLSLSDATCTSDSTKLQKYQQSFSDAFSLLEKME